MKKLMGGTALAALALSQAANAGGVERSPQSTAILFEEGNYAEFTYSSVDPSVSGVAAGGIYGTANTRDMAESYEQIDFGLKFALSEKFDVAFIHDTPVGADVFYPTGTGHIYAGGNADLNSDALSLYLKYNMQNNISVYGGLRSVTIGGDLGIPFFKGYSLEVEDQTELGHSFGIAWEKPEIAARVALTYHSATDHNLSSVENAPGSTPAVFPNMTNLTGQFTVTIPQAINLDFQSGVAPDTLVFGSIRWVDWSEFDITPPGFGQFDSLVDYDDDRITYNLGIGRRLNDNWSVAATAGYEKTLGGNSGNLGPTDGFSSLGLAASYTNGSIKVTGGVRHVWIGDTFTNGPLGGVLANFDDNSAWAWGVKVGYYF